MDTIDIKIFTDRDITMEDIEQLKSLKYINSVRLGKNGKILQVSFPRYFYLNNAYLITKEREVQEVIKDLIKNIEVLDYALEGVQSLREDYPFTFYRKNGETFSSYAQIWNLFSFCAEIEGWNDIPFGKEDRKTYIMQDTSINGWSRKKISIYNPASKVLDKEGDKKSENTLKDYPNFEYRTRMEVSLRYRRELDGYKGINLKEIKQKSFNIMEDTIFKNIDEAKEKAESELTKQLMFSREKNGKSFKMGEFIRDNKDSIYDYSILRSAIKKAYENKNSYESACKKSKSILIELEKKFGIFYIGNWKRVGNIKKQLKKECNRSTTR